MDDMQKLHALLKTVQEENASLRRHTVDQEFVMPPDHALEKKEYIRNKGDVGRLIAFFFDEKLTEDVSYKCFTDALKIDAKKAASIYQKFRQRRYSLEQKGLI